MESVKNFLKEHHKVVVVFLIIYLIYIFRMILNFEGKSYFVLFDDAMISMTYAKNFAEGFGLVWNPLETPVEGITNLFWTIIMSFFHIVGIPHQFTSLFIMFLGVLIIFTCGYLTKRIFLFQNPQGQNSTLLVIMILSYYPLIFWTLRGMEVGLQLMLILTGVLSTLNIQKNNDIKKYLVLLCACCSLAIMTRMDSILAFFIMGLFLTPKLVKKETCYIPISLVIVTLATLALQIKIRSEIYGEVLPNTYFLKVHGVSGWERLKRGVGALVNTLLLHWHIVLVTLLLFFKAVLKNKSNYLFLGIISLQIFYTCYVGGDAWEQFFFANRFFTICFPFLALIIFQTLNDKKEINFNLCFRLTGLIFLLVSTLIMINNLTQSNFVGLKFVRYIPLIEIIPWLILGIILLVYPLIKVKFPSYTPMAVLTTTMIVAINFRPYLYWPIHNAEDIHVDEKMLETALKLNQVASPKAMVAITHSGTLGYFLNTRKLDLLGKNDEMVAKTIPKASFTPGHNKWNLDYSIGEHRPDIIAQLFFKMDLKKWESKLINWGYIKMPNGMYVLKNSPHVNLAKWDKVF